MPFGVARVMAVQWMSELTVPTIDAIRAAGFSPFNYRVIAVLEPGRLTFAAHEVYMAHAWEILGRMRREEDLAPGTLAECLVELGRRHLRKELPDEYLRVLSVLGMRVVAKEDDKNPGPRRGRDVERMLSLMPEPEPGDDEAKIAELRRITSRPAREARWRSQAGVAAPSSPKPR